MMVAAATIKDFGPLMILNYCVAMTLAFLCVLGWWKNVANIGPVKGVKDFFLTARIYIWGLFTYPGVWLRCRSFKN
jgi:hypothetical protein